MRVIPSLVLLLATACGGRPMGAACAESAQCAGEGTCLKGVCSGYGCQQDADCDEGFTCGEVGGARACVEACAEDADCGGEQSCVDFEDTDEAVCL